MTRADLSKPPGQVAAMFDQVASRYDLTNDVLSGGMARWWRRATVAAVAPQLGERILDLAAGTGTSTMPLVKAGAEVVACDFSLGMVLQGRRRHPELAFVAGDALRLPFADASFDAVTMSFGLRNVADVSAALAELRRVTKPGGRLVVCEFSTPRNWGFRQVYQRGVLPVLPWISRRVSANPQAYSYLSESITSWPDQREVAQLLVAAGWRDVQWRNLTNGIVALHRARR